MIEIKILEILNADDRNLSYLANKTGLNYSALHKLANNETKSISFDTLARICLVLNVGVEDVLKLTKK